MRTELKSLRKPHGSLYDNQQMSHPECKQPLGAVSARGQELREAAAKAAAPPQKSDVVSAAPRVDYHPSQLRCGSP